jgi:hypothetical protein
MTFSIYLFFIFTYSFNNIHYVIMFVRFAILLIIFKLFQSSFYISMKLLQLLGRIVLQSTDMLVLYVSACIHISAMNILYPLSLLAISSENAESPINSVLDRYHLQLEYFHKLIWCSNINLFLGHFLIVLSGKRTK